MEMKVHCHVRKSLPLVLMLNKKNLIHSSISNFFQIHFSVIIYRKTGKTITYLCSRRFTFEKLREIYYSDVFSGFTLLEYSSKTFYVKCQIIQNLQRNKPILGGFCTSNILNCYFSAVFLTFQIYLAMYLRDNFGFSP